MRVSPYVPDVEWNESAPLVSKVRRIRAVMAGLVMILIFAVAMSSKSRNSSSAGKGTIATVETQERITAVANNIARSQEGLKKYVHNECSRVRKDWHDLTKEERKLYMDGFWELYRRGYVAIWFKAHSLGATHQSPNFLPWHRMFTYEFEGRIRALGGRFRCFALPYWDWSRMAGKPVAANPLWAQGFGGEGILSASDKAYYDKTGKYPTHSSLKIPGGCVLDGRFAKSTGFRTTTGDCLRRLFHSGTYWYQSTEQTLYLIEQRRKYANFDKQFETWHSPIHDAIGDGNLASQEPLFFLIHSYVDLVWSLRSDCHGYDGMEDWRTNEEIFTPSLLNTPLRFPYIDQLPSSISHYVQITPALSLNFPQFGIQYDFSDMWQRTKMQLSSCRFSYYHLRRPKPLPSGGVRVSDGAIATRGCKQAFAGCDHKAASVGCKGMEPSSLNLTVILERLGQKSNVCTKRWRVAVHKWMKKTGKNMMALCNGEYDPVCPFHL